MGTWTHPALGRKRRTAFRNNAVGHVASKITARSTYPWVLRTCELGNRSFSNFPAAPDDGLRARRRKPAIREER
jgi:hypothetical protein